LVWLTGASRLHHLKPVQQRNRHRFKAANSQERGCVGKLSAQAFIEIHVEKKKDGAGPCHLQKSGQREPSDSRVRDSFVLLPTFRCCFKGDAVGGTRGAF
jgi:hypothetical protein